MEKFNEVEGIYSCAAPQRSPRELERRIQRVSRSNWRECDWNHNESKIERGHIRKQFFRPASIRIQTNEKRGGGTRLTSVNMSRDGSESQTEDGIVI